MIPLPEKTTFVSEKILSTKDMQKIVQLSKKAGKTVGLCHGGYDLVHPGHMQHFWSAKNECDILVVSVTQDQYVNLRKGKDRPVYPVELRAYAIAQIACVDYVVIAETAKGIDIIKTLSPTYYIKGPDFITKQTPGIVAEREAIKSVGGEMRYTTDVALSTSDIIAYIQNMTTEKVLLVIDRDGTLITNNDYLGRNVDWKKEMTLNDDVVSYVSSLQTRFKPTTVVITNQSGVALGYFTENTVQEIHIELAKQLHQRGIYINDWQYCPDVDERYANQKGKEHFNEDYIKAHSDRKPSIQLVVNSLSKLSTPLHAFNKIIVLGDRHEDDQLAQNLSAIFIDVKGKNYQDLQALSL